MESKSTAAIPILSGLTLAIVLAGCMGGEQTGFPGIRPVDGSPADPRSWISSEKGDMREPFPKRRVPASGAGASIAFAGRWR